MSGASLIRCWLDVAFVLSAGQAGRGVALRVAIRTIHYLGMKSNSSPRAKLGSSAHASVRPPTSGSGLLRPLAAINGRTIAALVMHDASDLPTVSTKQRNVY